MKLDLTIVIAVTIVLVVAMAYNLGIQQEVTERCWVVFYRLVMANISDHYTSTFGHLRSFPVQRKPRLCGVPERGLSASFGHLEPGEIIKTDIGTTKLTRHEPRSGRVQRLVGYFPRDYKIIDCRY
jgi:hypothetical protein